MKRSQEIEQLTSGIVEALERGDIPYLQRSISRQPGTVVIGSDAKEYLRDYDRIIELMRASTPEGGGIHIRIAEIHGYENDDVGWADGVGAFERNGDSVEVRITAVYLRDKGQWTMIQNHASIGVPNESMFDPLFRRASAGTR